MKKQTMPGAATLRIQQGYTLVAVMVIILIVGIVATGSMNLSHVSEKSASNAIQRSRAFQSADGGAAVAQSSLTQLMTTRVFADSTASEGIYSSNSKTLQWWREPNYIGEQIAPTDTVLGVLQPPRYVLEEVGQFVPDGGTGIASIDLGSSAYGGRSRSGRDVVLYRIESHGTGSFAEVQSVVESIVAISY